MVDCIVGGECDEGRGGEGKADTYGSEAFGD